MQSECRVYATSRIFGEYIRNMKVVPGIILKDEEKRKKKEKELFEVIDDYCEQA